MSVLYHPIKANVVVDALSHMTMGSVSLIEGEKKELMKIVHRFSPLGVWLEILQMVVSLFIIIPSHH